MPWLLLHRNSSIVRPSDVSGVLVDGSALPDVAVVQSSHEEAPTQGVADDRNEQETGGVDRSEIRPT